MTQSFDLPSASDSLSASLAKLNGGLESLQNCFAGATAPDASIRVAGMFWFDTANALLKIRDAADAAWVVIARLDQVNYSFESNSYTFTAAAAGYSTEIRLPIFRAPYDMSVKAAHLLPWIATSGSDGSNYWESYIRNLTQSLDLCSAKWVSNGSELASGVAKDLAVDQNLDIAQGDVIAGTIRSVGAPTSLQHSPWTWSIQMERR